MAKNKIKILAIDDNKDNLITVKALIQDNFPDYTTLTATTGIGGIELAETEQPDVIVLDVVMPGMDGFEVCQKLKANPKTQDIPVVFATALKGDQDKRIRALEVGADGFLTKPLDEPELKAQIQAMVKIKEWVDQKNTAQETLASLVANKTKEIEETQIATMNLLEDLRDENEARRLNEIALRASEAALKKAQQVAHVGSWTWHIQQDRLEWSDEMYIIFGVDKETFNGKLDEVVASRIHPDDRAAVEASNRSVREEGKPIPLEYRVILPDSSERLIWAEAGEINIDSNGIPQTLSGIAQDVTERKKAEKQIHLQAAALDSAADAILITDREGKIEWVNPAYTQLTGYPADEILGQNPRMLKSGIQTDSYYKDLWDTILSGGVWRGELVNKRKDGTLYMEEESITPLLNSNGQVEHFIGIKVDITERKQQESEILKNNQDINLLYEAGKLLNQSLDLQTVYLSFYSLVSSTMKCDTLYISGYDPEKEMISAKFAIAAGKPVDVSDFPAIPLEPEGHGIQSPVIRSGQSRLINNYAEVLKRTQTNYFIDEEGKVVDEEDVPKDEPVTQSCVIVPILLNNQVTGVVQVQSVEKEAYSQHDLKIAEALVSQITVAANNAQLYQQSLGEIEARIQAENSLQVRARRQEMMASLGRELAATLDLLVIYPTAEKYIREMIDCPNFGVTLFDNQQRKLTAAYFVSDGEVIDIPTLPPLVFDPDQSSSGRSRAIASKTPVIANDLAIKVRTGAAVLVGSDQVPESAIYVPILVEEACIGLVEIQSYQQDAFSEEDGKWLSVVANQIGLAIQNARQFTRSAKRISELSAMNAIDAAVTAHLEPGKTYDVLLNQIIGQLKVDIAVLLLWNPHTKELNFIAEHGYLNKPDGNLRIREGESLAGQVVTQRRVLHVDGLSTDNQKLLKEFSIYEELEEYFGVPLIANNKLIGVLEVINRTPITADADWLRFLDLLAGQAAVVIDAIQLNENVKQANIELIKAYDATIEGWSQAMDLRDEETEGHTKRVTELTMQIGKLLGLKDEKLVHVKRGALLHDIGKLGVPDQILHKTGPLTDDEWIIMRKHPLFAFEMLSSIDYLRPAMAIPHCHHEKWDGTGYPRGLKGEKIPLEARIFSLVDVYDALTSDRPYRKAWDFERTMTYIADQSGKQFDPKITEKFLEYFQQFDPEKKL
jgi:PAS domain S-box-containing protein